MMHNIYPWQKKQWSHLSLLLAQNRLPHALLLNGIKDLGKRTFAIALAERLLCANSNEVACGVCQECQLLASGNHPDIHLVEPVDKSKVIKIEQIRELVEALTQTPQRGGPQVVVIHPMETLNAASSNALLKTLEEPQGDVVFLLVSHHMRRVPATIRSRCQRMDFSVPEVAESLHWLKSQDLPDHAPLETLLRLSEGVPLKAFTLAQSDHLLLHEKIMAHFLDVRLSQLSPLEAAEDLSSITSAQLFHVFSSAVMDIIHLQLHGLLHAIVNLSQQEKLQKVGCKIPVRQLFKFLDTLLLFKQRSDSSVSLNQQLLLEALLIEWATLTLNTKELYGSH